MQETTHRPAAASPQDIVNKHLVMAAGAGMLPLPYADAWAVTSVQLAMLKELSAHYRIPFDENTGKAIIASTAGGMLAKALAKGTTTLLKRVPGIGTVLGSTTMAFYSAALTYALGMVLIRHFESGGSIVDFEYDKVKHYLISTFERGKDLILKMFNLIKDPVPSGGNIPHFV